MLERDFRPPSLLEQIPGARATSGLYDFAGDPELRGSTRLGIAHDDQKQRPSGPIRSSSPSHNKQPAFYKVTSANHIQGRAIQDAMKKSADGSALDRVTSMVQWRADEGLGERHGHRSRR